MISSLAVPATEVNGSIRTCRAVRSFSRQSRCLVVAVRSSPGSGTARRGEVTKPLRPPPSRRECDRRVPSRVTPRERFVRVRSSSQHWAGHVRVSRTTRLVLGSKSTTRASNQRTESTDLVHIRIVACSRKTRTCSLRPPGRSSSVGDRCCEGIQIRRWCPSAKVYGPWKRRCRAPGGCPWYGHEDPPGCPTCCRLRLRGFLRQPQRRCYAVVQNTKSEPPKRELGHSGCECSLVMCKSDVSSTFKGTAWGHGYSPSP